MDLNIILISNGPGEMSTWVKPLMAMLRKALPAARVVIALVPCPHSSGQEKAYSERLHGAYTLTPEDTLHYLLTGQLPKGLALAKTGVILQLGGDLLFGVSFKWRTGYPLTVYTEHLVQWKRQVSRFYFKHRKDYEAHQKRLRPGQGVYVGDLMRDAVKVQALPLEIRQKLKLRDQAPVVALLPGSKPLKVLYTTAFFMKLVDEISLLMPQVQFILLQSPFTPLTQLRNAVQDPKYIQVLKGSSAKIVHHSAGTALVTPQGNQVQIIEPSANYAAMQVADLSLTLPGTNTAELAALGCPMMVLLPLQQPELLPLDGILQQLGRIPWLGKRLKRRLVLSHLKKIPYLALPNQKAQRMIVPEYRGELYVEALATEAVKLLEDPLQRREMRQALRQTMPEDRSASLVCLDLIALLENHSAEFARYYRAEAQESIF